MTIKIKKMAPMRIMTICAICLFLISGLRAQNYYVMSVSGNVTTDGRLLQKKDKLDDSTPLAFDSPEAFVYVISPGKGYYILSGKEAAAETRSSEIVLSLKEALFPPNEFHSTSTRSGGVATSHYFATKGDLQSFFKNEILLIGPSEFTVNARIFPMSDQQYFEMTLNLPGRVATESLPFEENRFFIDESTFRISVEENNAQKPQLSSLVYVNKTTGDMTRIGEFTTNFMSREEVLEELRILYNVVSPVPSNMFFMEHAKPYLYNNYGNTNWSVVQKMVEEEFGK